MTKPLEDLLRAAAKSGSLNHISIAYVAQDKLQDVLRAFVAQALTQGIQVQVAGAAAALL